MESEPELQQLKLDSEPSPKKARIEKASVALDSIHQRVKASFEEMKMAERIYVKKLGGFNVELWTLLETELRHCAREKCGGIELASKEAALDFGLQLFRDELELSRAVFSCYRGYHEHRFEEDSYKYDCSEKLTEVVARLAEMPALGEEQLRAVLTGLKEEGARMERLVSAVDGTESVDDRREIAAKYWKVFDLAVQQYARQKCNTNLADLEEAKWFSHHLIGCHDQWLIYNHFQATDWCWPCDPEKSRLRLKFISFLMKRLERMPALEEKELKKILSKIGYWREEREKQRQAVGSGAEAIKSDDGKGKKN